jgi:predicted dehydrogenase
MLKAVMAVGVLGLGSIGARHAKNLADLGYMVRKYDPILLKNELHNTIRSSDAIVIASPTSLHLEHIKIIADHYDLKDKPTFVEKPISDTYDEVCRDVIMVGCNQRFNPCVIQAKKWLDGRSIGKPIWACFTCAQFTEKSPYLRDGVTFNWGAHEIDLALHLLGPAVVTGASINADDSIADILMTHENGCRTTIHLDYRTTHEIRGFYIVGELSDIRANLPRRLTSKGVVTFPHTGSYDDDYVSEMKSFIARCNGEETLGATGRDGLDVLKICIEAKRLSACYPENIK